MHHPFVGCVLRTISSPTQPSIYFINDVWLPIPTLSWCIKCTLHGYEVTLGRFRRYARKLCQTYRSVRRVEQIKLNIAKIVKSNPYFSSNRHKSFKRNSEMNEPPLSNTPPNIQNRPLPSIQDTASLLTPNMLLGLTIPTLPYTEKSLVV